MNFVILDLEWNAAYSKRIHGYLNEIIEFGAVKCDENLHVISRFSSFVHLSVGKRLSQIVSELTEIDDASLSDALPYMQVVSKFRRWAGDSILLTWGTSDILALIENCRYFSGDETVPFLCYYADLQRYCETRLGTMNTGEQLGLNKAADMLNIDISNIKHHRALGDALISLEIFNRIYTKETLRPLIEDCRRDEFYRKMTFRNHYLCDIDNPEVRKGLRTFTCERCGGECQRNSKWKLINKRFTADFRCSSCGYVFSGRVQIKMKYEGVAVTRKSVPLPVIEEPRKVSPGRVGSMNLNVSDEGVAFLTFPSWENEKDIIHAFSTRVGGKSEGVYSALNLGLRRGDNDELVLENFRMFSRAVGTEIENLVAGAQDHHTNIRRVTKENCGTGILKPKDMESIDGLCTDESGVSLIIYAADCVPIYYYDKAHHAIGLAHAGWRGTVADMAGTMVRKMQSEFGTDPSELVCAIGPSIGPESFEVDKPCADEFVPIEKSETFIRDDGGDKFHVDLWEVNRLFLVKAGVKPENISLGAVDTYVNSDLIFSHRKTKGQRGSNAAVLSLR